MSREVRRVPKDWEHPRDGSGRYVPLFCGGFKDLVEKWDMEAEMWNKGLCRYSEDEWKEKGPNQSGTYAEWAGLRPEEKDYMPDWPEEECTHIQMYETSSEGTPISPVMETPEALARWLADKDAGFFGEMCLSYEEWLNTING